MAIVVPNSDRIRGVKDDSERAGRCASLYSESENDVSVILYIYMGKLDIAQRHHDVFVYL